MLIFGWKHHQIDNMKQLQLLTVLFVLLGFGQFLSADDLFEGSDTLKIKDVNIIVPRQQLAGIGLDISVQMHDSDASMDFVLHVWIDGSLSVVDLEPAHEGVGDGVYHPHGSQSWPVLESGRREVVIKIFRPLRSQTEFEVQTQTVSFFKAADERNILMEKFTGTWCGWCPNGDWIADTLAEMYPNLILVDIHSGDPMEIQDGNTLKDAYFSGFPSATLNRKKFDGQNKVGVHWLEWEDVLEESFGFIIPFEVACDVSYNEDSHQLDIITDVFSLGVIGGDHRVITYIIENEYINDSPNFGQANFYDEVEDHPHFGLGDPIQSYPFVKVVREIIGGPWGYAGIIPDPTVNDEVYTLATTWELPEGANPEDYSVVVAVADHNEDLEDRKLINSFWAPVVLDPVMETPVETPVQTAETMETPVTAETPQDTVALSIQELLELKYALELWPNPAESVLNFRLNTEVGVREIRIKGINGDIIKTLDLVEASNEGKITVEALLPGVYLIEFLVEEGRITRKWVR